MAHVKGSTMKSLSDKIALITGATSGIGEATALEFAAAGCNLILTGRREQRLRDLCARIESQYQVKTLALQFDVRDKAAVAREINGLPKEWQNIDILVSNAGLALGISKMQDAKLEDWETMFDTNVKGLLYVTHAVLPGMVARNRGDIVHIGSIAGHEVYPGGNIYCSTKHAVNAIAKGLRIDLAATNIRVSSIDPGMVETEFSEVRLGDKQKAKAVYAGMQPLTAKDIAEGIMFIVSRPPHVQIAEIIIFPTAQGAATVVHRETEN